MTTPIITPAEALEAAVQILDDEANAVLDRELDFASWAGGDPRGPDAAGINKRYAAKLREHAVAIRALSSRISEPVAVVKPLVWDARGTDFWRAKGTDRVYQIMELADGRVFLTHGPRLYDHTTLEAAKAAAQADYEARILSALTIKPAAQVQAGAYLAASERLEKRARFVYAKPLSYDYTVKSDEATRAEILALTPADAKAALDRRIEKAEKDGAFRALRDTDRLFVNDGKTEDRFVEDMKNACPACGGSGHKDDAAENLARRDAETREKALREAAEVATRFLVGDPAKGIPLRNPMAHEIAAAILALIGGPAHG